MMAEDMDSDACVGSKRRITEIEETLLLQQQQELSDSIFTVSTREDSKEKESSWVASSTKEDQEIMNDLPSPGSSKKVNCSLTELHSSTEENQEMLSSVDEEKVVLFDMDPGSFSSEENSEYFARKIGNFSVKVQETKDSVVGSVSYGERNKVEIDGTFNGVKGKKGKEISGAKNEEFDGNGVLAECKSFENEAVSVIEEEKGFLEMEKMEAESMLEAKKKQLLAKVDAGSIFKDEIHVDNALGFDATAGILGSIKGIDESVRRSLKVEVIDDTALIATVPDSKKSNGRVDIVEKKNEKQEADGKKAKRPRRKGKEGIKDFQTSDVQKRMTHVGKDSSRMIRVVEAQNAGKKNGDHKIKYTREEMEAMRFVNTVEQRKLWKAIYTGLGDAVVREYNDLASSRHLKNVDWNNDPWQRFGRKEDAHGILSKACSENGDIELDNIEENGVENLKLLDFGCESAGGKNAEAFMEEDCNEEDDSDEDYASIQRPAFLVEGEPDFESGPPEDGLEYLRRVRWEAAHIPKVTVAKLDRSKFHKEQSVYMPQIPEIDKCPEHLLPLKQWEDAFLADFSELQRFLSYNEDSTSSTEISCKLKSMAIVDEQNTSSPQLSEGIIFEEFNNPAIDEVHSSEVLHGSCLDQQYVAMAKDSNIIAFSQNRTPSSVSDFSCKYPTFSAILTMDSVARVSMLRKHISLAVTMSTLSKEDCVWLFALCAAVDTPVDADTCAALRSLLRKCASLRAAKSELDDEVIMLNILATISGRYFGQSGS